MKWDGVRAWLLHIRLDNAHHTSFLPNDGRFLRKYDLALLNKTSLYTKLNRSTQG